MCDSSRYSKTKEFQRSSLAATHLSGGRSIQVFDLSFGQPALALAEWRNTWRKVFVNAVEVYSTW